MNKPGLFLDFDNTKFDTWSAHVVYFNKKYGISSIAADYVDNPRLDKVLGRYLPADRCPTNDEIYRDLGKNFLASIEEHAEVKPIEGMCEIVPLLAKKYSLWIVTARQKIGRPVIQYLIDLHIPDCIDGIHNVWEHLEDGTVRGVSKRMFISSFPGEKAAFLDDSPSEIIDLQDVLPCYLFDPKGMNDGDARIRNRVRSWMEIGDLFL